MWDTCFRKLGLENRSNRNDPHFLQQEHYCCGSRQGVGGRAVALPSSLRPPKSVTFSPRNFDPQSVLISKCDISHSWDFTGNNYQVSHITKYLLEFSCPNEWFFTIFTHCATPNVQMNLETSKPSPATFILRATFLDPLLMEYLCPFSSSHLEFDFDLTHSSSRSSTSITLHTTLLKWHKSFGTCD